MPADAPEGLCPNCILKAGLQTDGLSQTGASAPGGGSRADSFVPPTPAELAPFFPDLEILELVGRGGMGMVYKARQKHLDRLVALKILSPKIGRDPAFAERFAREARAMAMLSHPHIVAVHDFGRTEARGEERGARGEGASDSPLPLGEAPASGYPGVRAAGGEGGLFYFLMEFVDGVNLRLLLDAGKLAPQAALAIVPQICDALQYAHDKGVVHRDIKPENVLLDKEGQVKIADFGLAKLMGREARDFTLTGAGQVMGTPQYMAPEQIEHPQEVDHRADIYSLGVVFYQMLTGELPIGRFAPPSKKVQIDVRLDEVVLHALEKEPELRYQHASEVKIDVETIITSAPPAAGGFAQSGDTAPRFSRVAVIASVLALTAVLLFVVRILIARMCSVTEPLVVSSIILLGAVVTLARFATTILGCVGIMQIRHSAGRLRGLALALFGALLFPLVELDGLIEKCIYMLAVGGGQPSTFLVSVLTLILSITVDVLIVYWAWRAVKRLAGGQSPVGELAGATPSSAAPAADDAAIEQARHQVRGPAIGLLVTGIFNWVVALPITLIVSYYTMASKQGGPGGVVLLAPILLVVFSVLVLVAALKMKRLQAYGLAIAAGILAIIISPANLIGLPIGIWALVVLSQRDVRAAFAQNRQHAASGASGTPAKPRTWWRRWWAEALIVLLLAVGIGLTITAHRFRDGGPSDLRMKSTRQLLQKYLPEQVEQPWAWNELQARLKAGSLSQDDVDDAVKVLIAHMTATRPQGWDQPLNWPNQFLGAATKGGMISPPVLLDLCDALCGPKPVIRLPRWREGKDGLPITIVYGSAWNTHNQDCLGVELLWQVERVSLDGKPIEVRDNHTFGENWSGTCPGTLKAGDHQVVADVQCAYVDEDKLIGLNGGDLPADRWPEARKRWKQSVSATLKVYTAGEPLVSLVTD
ncbi:MAG: serine/threonine-protein kinase, partial [Thermoguttaceae bacterium]